MTLETGGASYVGDALEVQGEVKVGKGESISTEVSGRGGSKADRGLQRVIHHHIACKQTVLQSKDILTICLELRCGMQ